MLVPALLACNITVWVGCRNLDTSACMALLSNSFASVAAAESGGGGVAEMGTGSEAVEAPRTRSLAAPR